MILEALPFAELRERLLLTGSHLRMNEGVRAHRRGAVTHHSLFRSASRYRGENGLFVRYRMQPCEQ